jgi:2-methylcitrate dehydratase PrpD
MIRGHPGASFVGGVLAAALAGHAKYREYLETLIVSYEVTVRWALAMQNYYDFMHSTGAYGAFGTASGVGRLFGLDKKILNNALSIADFHAPMTPVMRAVEYPSMNKDGVPFGTVMGALAVIEALEGYEGKTHLLEMSKYRYLLDSLGSEYEIMNLYFKPYTCCRWAHQPIAACLDLMKEHGFGHENVEKITVHTFSAAARLSTIVPATTDEAQYNIAYPVAAAVVHGELGYLQICDKSLKRRARA